MDSRFQIGWRPFVPQLIMAGVAYTVGAIGAAQVSLPWLGLTWSVVFVVGWIVALRLRQRQQFQTHLDVVELVRDGQFALAGEKLDALCTHPASIPSHMMFIYSRAVVFQCMGDFDRALALYDAILEARGWGPRRVLATHGGLYRARVAEAYAWAGDLDKARQLLKRAREDGFDGEALILPEAIVALRQGDAQRAVDLLDAGWPTLEEHRVGHELSPAHLVYALASRGLDGAMDDGREERAHALTPRALSITSWAGTRWPEMAEVIRDLQEDAVK